MKIALIQQHATRDKTDNMRRGLAALDAAAAERADVVGFAELAFERFHPQRPAGGDPLRARRTGPGADDRRLRRARARGTAWSSC